MATGKTLEDFRCGGAGGLIPVTSPAASTKAAVYAPALLRGVRAAFSFPVLLGALLVAAACLIVSLKVRQDAPPEPGTIPTSIFEGDTWMHIDVGEGVLATHTWRRTDAHSFTAAGSEWIDYEWLGDVVIAGVFKLGGLRGLTALLLASVTAFLLLVYYLAYLYSGNSKAAFVALAPMLPLAALCFTMRPQFFGYVFLALTLVALERFRQGKRKMLWILPAIILLWVNTHSTFIFGLMALALYWACGLVEFRAGSLEAKRWTLQERLQLELVGLLSAVALTLTPYGTRLATIPFEFLRYPLGMQYIIEFQPLGTIAWVLRLFMLLILFFLFGEMVLHPPHRLEQFALISVGIYLAAVHGRFVVLFVAAFAPFLAILLARWLPAYDAAKDKRYLNAALIALIVAAMLHYFPSDSQLRKALARSFPEGAVRYLREHPVRGNLFNTDYWGMYLVRKLGPQQKIFMDGRSQLYEGTGVFADYIKITKPDPQALALLGKYAIGACLIPRGTTLATLLSVAPGWHEAYGDDLSVLYVRDRGSRHPDVVTPSDSEHRVEQASATIQPRF